MKNDIKSDYFEQYESFMGPLPTSAAFPELAALRKSKVYDEEREFQQKICIKVVRESVNSVLVVL